MSRSLPFPRAAAPLSRGRALALLLIFLTAFAGFAALVGAHAQNDSPDMSATAVKIARMSDVFVIYRNAKGETTCRLATENERRQLNKRDGAGSSRTIYAGGKRPWLDEGNAAAPARTETGTPLLPSAGLRIVLHGTQQLQNNPAARDAFIVAANRWEALVSTAITVVVDADFGPTFFGDPFDNANILGATATEVQHAPLSSVRQQLINNAPEPEELQLYSALPTNAVPVELNGATTSASSIRMTWPTSRALGLRPDITDPAAVPLGFGDAAIGFNSAHTFDFNPNDGITSGTTDFDAVVVHEMGHALGFISESGDGSASPLSVWDIFRFRPGTASLGTMATASRVMSEGGAQVFFNNRTNSFGTAELELSTGGSDGVGGDGEQSSHWKDDGLTGTFIGVMDPTLPRGRREVLTDNDLKALDTFGFRIGGTAPPPPPPPPAPGNDSFSAAVALSGATGSVTGTNVGATGEAGEPDHAGVTGTGRRSVWYSWMATGNGQTNFNTSGSDYDTVLGIYTGNAVNALTLIGANDDVQIGVITHSSVTFNAVAGTTYRVAVDGFQSDTGSITLTWSGPAPTPTPPPVPTFNITGRVIDPAGNGIEGVRLAVDGPPPANGLPLLPVLTDTNGNFAFMNLVAGGNYTVRGDDSRFIFNPPSVVFNNLSANQFVTFTATRPGIDLRGRIVENGAGLAGVTVWLLHQATQQTRSTVTGSDGRYQFAGAFLNDVYEVIPLKDGYTFSPPSLILPAIFPDLGDINAIPGNQIDGSEFFVAQHYRDFLGREADPLGLAFWRDGIESCGPFGQCRQVRRVDASAAFFLSIEFQETGYFVYRMYEAAFGDINPPTVPVPIRRAEFIPDAQQVGQGVEVGIGPWQERLEANKVAYANVFVGRPRFTAQYPVTMTAAQFVDTLFARGGVTPTPAERQAAITAFESGGTTGRAAALRSVADSQTLRDKEFRKAFVLMQYFGYLRRDPDGGQDTNFDGFNFWLNKLNQFNGDFRQAEMVRAFIVSIEYRHRFGQ